MIVRRWGAPGQLQKKKKGVGYKPNSVTSRGHGHFTGDTGCPAPLATYPETSGGQPVGRLSIWSCSRWGLPCPPCHHGGGELLPRHFTLTRHSAGYTITQMFITFGFSISSSLIQPAECRAVFFCGTFHRSPGVRVTNHPALGSSDFPLRYDYRSDHAPTPILRLIVKRDIEKLKIE